MYAIIDIGGKQYKVTKDDVINIERQDKKERQEFSLTKVLLVSDSSNTQIGQPYVKAAKVKAVVVKNLKSRKTIAFKNRRRKDSHSKTGHRQLLSQIKIKEITCQA